MSAIIFDQKDQLRAPLLQPEEASRAGEGPHSGLEGLEQSTSSSLDSSRRSMNHFEESREKLFGEGLIVELSKPVSRKGSKSPLSMDSDETSHDEDDDDDDDKENDDWNGEIQAERKLTVNHSFGLPRPYNPGILSMNYCRN